ncbi:hypothetical protein CDD83_6044 [Cordyceps sp. RAO-2017]|nr:hypothetical protein CDD83_6044 [Cordyceps sp. RAO-2017]
MVEWSSLPFDIRLAIFEALAQNVLAVRPGKGRLDRPRMQKHGLSKYSLVCKEWQPFFEKQLYSNLTITKYSLYQFRHLVVRQRALVKHIWLKIECETYECPWCVFNPNGNRKRKCAADDATARRAISGLLRTLADWDRDRVACPGSLTLEISAHSPSDLEHVFMNELYFDTSSWGIDELQHDAPLLNDIGHGWANGRRTQPQLWISLDRLFGHGHYTLPDFYCRLPQVQLVGRFILRRQTRRTFHPESLTKLLQSFPNLNSVIYEPWRDLAASPYEEVEGDRPYWWTWSNGLLGRDLGYSHVISESLPDTLRELTLFEDFNEDYLTIARIHRGYKADNGPVSPRKTPSRAVGRALAKRSIPLVRLSASYLVDAGEFFRAVDPAWVWKSLVSLSLTSHHLVETLSADVSRLLVEAGTTALQMPQLRRMDIWNGSKGNAWIFSYEITDQHTMIKWRGTWHLALDSDIRVADVWSKVAKLYTRRDLTVASGEILDKDSISSHAMAIQKLGLGEREVVHPVSLKQIEKETEGYWYK